MKVYLTPVISILFVLITEQSLAISNSETVEYLSDSNNVTIVLVMCQISRKEDLRYIRKEHDLNGINRQYNHVLTLLKSLVITWRHGNHPSRKSESENCDVTGFLNVVVFTNHAPSTRGLKKHVASWDSNYTSCFNLSFRKPNYPKSMNLN